MKHLAVVGLSASGLLAAACGLTTDGIATTASSSKPSPLSTSAAPLTGVSAPTTAAANPRVTDTTFDGCASVTDAEATSWELDPASKTDTKDRSTLGAENVRGCLWDGDKWQVRVYSVNGSITQWEKPNPDFDPKTQFQFGTRQGWLAHDAPPKHDCTAVVASEHGIAAVQVIPSTALEDANTNVCPITQKIMTTIAPRIP
ncbi:Protein of uncharacterised function (DUF3558) [Mycobacteroides abscessus subsp. massiliense]|uniref:Protein of uncharacterized function (DUF3558) n=1 Tax=Mycobacteroides abscessus subsp. massiliense TaxID=1962118 RepID=A0A1T5WHS6_9MYCO|nr:DUF3558 family protein [Mycobacteroides abscessus]ORA92589.1 hypothetical protein BST32_04490 [Mycobacteroides abscessus subsp. massiliense]SKD82551.1 Protein of uncharacterised function (DUF3558) [Mycobacteroides abscessus subsp. massiliense]SKD94214.1 Protein of uncharacterised function (DUF3558) [Mycobacteroides abscessus subsp. massiliense]SKD97993.1 Protein of uncharacterised function (DUF3558) [Mycobacteroides abscessus subsp. massiliense]SKE40842.1 Protein of uncharacterised function